MVYYSLPCEFLHISLIHKCFSLLLSPPFGVRKSVNFVTNLIEIIEQYCFEIIGFHFYKNTFLLLIPLNIQFKA